MEEKKALEELTFKEGLNELQSIVDGLESNQLELEESIESYERGVKLLGVLRKSLENAQQRVTVCMGELEEDDGDNIDNKLS